MKFIKTEDLKVGMRLARPIYNKQGVLLFDRDSKLTHQGIASVRNFGLIGIYVLEPAEPVPPMTREDMEFERFQTVAVFSIQEDLQKILTTKKQNNTKMIAGMIIKNYGHLDNKINFIQNLRSRENYVYKHSLNVAILCTLMCHATNMKLDEQLNTVIAAIVHDIGKLSVEPRLLVGENLTEEQKYRIKSAEIGAFNLIEGAYTEGMTIKRICMQSHKLLEDIEKGIKSSVRPSMAAQILAVAEAYDSMTAMKLESEPVSEVKAIRFLLEHEEYFGTHVVNALIRTINILVPGISVELNTGEKALVLNSNDLDILRPMVLSFRDNSIIDLSDEKNYGDLVIEDIMKTLDNRYVFDTNTLLQAGFTTELEFI